MFKCLWYSQNRTEYNKMESLTKLLNYLKQYKHQNPKEANQTY